MLYWLNQVEWLTVKISIFLYYANHNNDLMKNLLLNIIKISSICKELAQLLEGGDDALKN